MGNIPSKKELRKGPDDHGFQINTRVVLGGIVTFALVVFIAGNSQDAKIQFLLFSATLPLWIVLAGTALFGAAIGALLTQRRQRRKDRNA